MEYLENFNSNSHINGELFEWNELDGCQSIANILQLLLSTKIQYLLFIVLTFF